MLTCERVHAANGVTLVGSLTGSVAFGFTERTGGVSLPPYASLNLGTHVGDDPAAVEENRRRVLEALGAADALSRLLVPNQVHGDHVACVRTGSADELASVREEIAAGTDAIVCTAPGVPVMLCFADCVPVVLVCAGGCAVVHSGWKGTYAGIAGKAARVLSREAHVEPRDIQAFIGPHILGDEYEVSSDLMERFSERFRSLRPAPGVQAERLLDLARAITETLVDAGLEEENVCDLHLSTLSSPERFFSYRGEDGRTGRHAAVAVLR